MRCRVTVLDAALFGDSRPLRCTRGVHMASKCTLQKGSIIPPDKTHSQCRLDCVESARYVGFCAMPQSDPRRRRSAFEMVAEQAHLLLWERLWNRSFLKTANVFYRRVNPLASRFRAGVHGAPIPGACSIVFSPAGASPSRN